MAVFHGQDQLDAPVRAPRPPVPRARLCLPAGLRGGPGPGEGGNASHPPKQDVAKEKGGEGALFAVSSPTGFVPKRVVSVGVHTGKVPEDRRKVPQEPLGGRWVVGSG